MKAQAGKKTGAAGGGEGISRKKSRDWDLSLITDRDLAGLRRDGRIPSDKNKVRKPGSEVFPKPQSGWTVVFLAFFARDLSLPAH